MEIDRRAVLNGLAATTACAATAPLPVARSAVLSLSKPEAFAARWSIGTVATFASLWVESLSRASSAKAREQVDEVMDDIEELQFAEHGYTYERPRPGDPPDFERGRLFSRLWNELPLEKRAAITLKAVAARFERGYRADYAAAYVLVWLSRDAPGGWFEDKLEWALHALHRVDE